MNTWLSLLSVWMVMFITFPLTAQPCSTFVLEGDERLVMGKNYDFSVGDGMVVVNKRNVSKTSLVTGANPVEWTSKYGSVTFNQFGREMPNGGINEAGLVVEVLWLDRTVYPPPDSRPTTGNLQWIQYQLDNFNTVDEVISSDSQLRILSDRSQSKVHYLVCDRTGACASVEFLEGHMVVHTGESMPVKVLTNHTYTESNDYLMAHNEFGGTDPITCGTSSLDRFVCASYMLKTYDPAMTKSPVDYAFSILNSVSQGAGTKWSIVYDITNLAIHFRTLYNQQIRSLALERFEYACGTPVMTMDVNGDGSGDVSKAFAEYTFEANHELVKKVFGSVDFLKAIPAEAVEYVARYPTTTTCGK